jgi:hypothetical protein
MQPYNYVLERHESDRYISLYEHAAEEHFWINQTVIALNSQVGWYNVHMR